uniref:peptidylprolyl isomerase n=1 Tax=Eutreptiella gymnastica TaxID=73025 RepID=A0A7S4CY75_9EUGL
MNASVGQDQGHAETVEDDAEEDTEGEVLEGPGLEVVGVSISNLKIPVAVLHELQEMEPEENEETGGFVDIVDETQMEASLSPRSQELKVWLEKIGMMQYFPAFEEFGVALADISTMTNNALKAMGISSDKDRERLLAAAAGDHEVEEEIGGDDAMLNAMGEPVRIAGAPIGGGSVSNGCRARQILVKHKDSKVPSSWREDPITRTKAEAVALLRQYRGEIIAGTKTFEEIASNFSDCSSAGFGGDLGELPSLPVGDLHPKLEAALYSLQIGEMSDVVDTDSGVLIVLRTKSDYDP